MRSIKQAAVAVVAVTCLSAAPASWGDARPNPYQTIVDRNPFAIKPPPPPKVEEEPPPLIPPAKVVLTGVLNVFGPPRALIEITETEPGKAPVIQKEVAQVGERYGAVEVLSIDVEHASVRIRNGKIETNLVFEVAKGPAAPTGPGMPGAFPTPPQLLQPHPAPAGAASPLTFSPNNINSARGAANVSTYGAPAATTANPAAPNIPGPNPFPVYPSGTGLPTPNLNTIGANNTSTPGNTGVGTYGAGNTSIPYRQPRTFPNVSTGQPQK